MAFLFDRGQGMFVVMHEMIQSLAAVTLQTGLANHKSQVTPAASLFSPKVPVCGKVSALAKHPGVGLWRSMTDGSLIFP